MQTNRVVECKQLTHTDMGAAIALATLYNRMVECKQLTHTDTGAAIALATLYNRVVECKPVSYTHLDVYKRQVYILQCTLISLSFYYYW